MQRYKMYSIRDSKGDAYHPPFYKRTHGEAERDFLDLANDTQTTVGKHPEDYDLFYLGEFSDDSGKIESLPAPQHIAKAIEKLTRQ